MNFNYFNDFGKTIESLFVEIMIWSSTTAITLPMW
jgi:hypothetical protein